MLKVKLVCVGGIKEKFFAEAVGEYLKRLKRFCKIEVLEIDEKLKSNKPSQAEIVKALESEGAEVLSKAEGFTVALDKSGKQTSSIDFAEFFKQVGNTHSAVTFVVGGSHGLGESVKKSADTVLSLGEMTFPHHLFRVMLAEQIYRAFSINAGSDYHK